MKWVAALLMIVNVALYLWISGEQITVEDVNNAPRPDVNKEGMLLLSEVASVANTEATEPDGQGSEQEIGDPVEESAQGETNVIEDEQTNDEVLRPEPVVVVTPDPQSEAIEETENAGMCYRIGPFKGSTGWEQATSWMQENGIEFRHVTSDRRELRAMRVFLGPFDTISAAEPTVQLLKSKNLDHFVYLVEDGHARISLGYFTQEELATKFLAYLQSLDVDAKSQPEYRLLGPYNWMEVPAAAVDFGKLNGYDWPEPSVGLTRAQC